MLAWAWILILVAAVGVMVYAFWSYHKKTAARVAASQQRFAELLREQTTASGRAVSPPAAVPATPAPAQAAAPVAAAVPASTPTPAPAPAIGAAAARDRFLGQHETLLYLLLKTGLADHEIFANVSLASVVALPAAGAEREQQLRRLAPYQLGFVVCDKSMRVVAAVDIESAGGADAAGIHQFKAETLKSAGIRLVRVNPGALPKRDQVRALVIGGATPPAANPS